MARKLPALSPEWENFVLCLMLHLILPLIPLGAEFVRRSYVSDASLTLGAAMYAISIGGSSRNKLQFGFSILMCITYSIAFGIIAGRNANDLPSAGISTPSNFYAGIGFVLIFAFHALERYNRHVVESRPYWEFS